jgi:hypothetical protein
MRSAIAIPQFPGWPLCAPTHRGSGLPGGGVSLALTTMRRGHFGSICVRSAAVRPASARPRRRGSRLRLSAQAVTRGRENQLSDTERDHGRDERALAHRHPRPSAGARAGRLCPLALPTNWPPGGTAGALSPERFLCGRSLDGRLTTVDRPGGGRPVWQKPISGKPVRLEPIRVLVESLNLRRLATVVSGQEGSEAVVEWLAEKLGIVGRAAEDGSLG